MLRVAASTVVVALVCAAAPTPSRMFLPGPTAAAAQEGLPIDVEVGASREILSGDREPWEDYWIRATYRAGPGRYVYGGVRWTRRFGLEDHQLEAGGGLPLAPDWSLAVGGTLSPTGRVLPDWGASGTVTHRLSPEWSVYAGGGRQEWDSVAVNTQHVGVRRHFERFLLGYRAGFHQLDPVGSGVSHTVTGTFFYGRGSAISLGLGVGRGAAIVGSEDVRTVSERSGRLSGIHWLDEHTGVSYTFGIHRHEDFFSRSTSSIGIRRRF